MDFCPRSKENRITLFICLHYPSLSFLKFRRGNRPKKLFENRIYSQKTKRVKSVLMKSDGNRQNCHWMGSDISRIVNLFSYKRTTKK